MILVLVTIVHVIVCLFLIAVVLLQSGASADLAGAFGGLGSQTAFGPRAGANLLTKLTTWAAIIFMLSSFTLAIISTRHSGGSGSVLDNSKSVPTQSVPSSK
jgi:preprotein translocase subunit SecG